MLSFPLVYLFNGISSLHGLFNAEILFIHLFILVWFMSLTAYQVFMDYLMPKFD